MRVGIAPQRDGSGIRVKAPGDRCDWRAAAEVDADLRVGFNVSVPLRARTEACDDNVAARAGAIDDLQHDVASTPGGPSGMPEHQQPGPKYHAQPGPVQPDGRADEPSDTEEAGADTTNQALEAHNRERFTADPRWQR